MMFKPGGGKFRPCDRDTLAQVARRIVEESHSKTQSGPNGFRDCPIGKGGKGDDTSCVVGEVVEWTEEHGEAWANLRRRTWFKNFFTCGGAIPSTDQELNFGDDRLEYGTGARVRNYPTNPNASFSTYWGSFSEYGSSFAGFSSLASGWGKIKDGEHQQAYLGDRPTMKTFASRRQKRILHTHVEDEDEEEEENCSIM